MKYVSMVCAAAAAALPLGTGSGHWHGEAAQAENFFFLARKSYNQPNQSTIKCYV